MFRPCIDLHEGKVKQIVGGSLGETGLRARICLRPLRRVVRGTLPARRPDRRPRDDAGPGNENEACAAIAAYPGGLQIGGGINAGNARDWLDGGASHVIVTSWVFREGRVDWNRLAELVKAVGKNRLVLDLSCRRRGKKYFVVTDRWQKFTELAISPETLAETCRQLRGIFNPCRGHGGFVPRH